MRFGDYRISAIDKCFAIEKAYIAKTGKKKGQECWRAFAYMGRFSQAIRRLSNEITLENYPDVARILEKLDAIEKEVKSWKGDLVYVVGKIKEVEGLK